MQPGRMGEKILSSVFCSDHSSISFGTRDRYNNYRVLYLLMWFSYLTPVNRWWFIVHQRPPVANNPCHTLATPTARQLPPEDKHPAPVHHSRLFHHWPGLVPRRFKILQEGTTSLSLSVGASKSSRKVKLNSLGNTVPPAYSFCGFASQQLNKKTGFYALNH